MNGSEVFKFAVHAIEDSTRRALKRGVSKDEKEAARLIREGAERGHAPSQYRLGLLYGAGRGVPQDHRQAVRWFRKSADQGFAAAQRASRETDRLDRNEEHREIEDDAEPDEPRRAGDRVPRMRQPAR